MQNTYYPNGFPNGVSIRGMTVLNTYSGSVFYVDSTDPNCSAGGPGTYGTPFNTISNALTLCTADKGDVILVRAGHVETITSAGGITVSKNGVAIVGLGQGADRPQITFSTATTASFLISGNSVSVVNLVGIPALNAIAQPFDITGSDCYVDVEVQDASTILECVRALRATSCSRLTAYVAYNGQTGGSSCVNAVRLTAVSGAIINLDVYGKFSTSVVQFITTACTDVEVYGYMYNSGTTDFSKDVIDTATGSTWFASFNDGSFGGRVSGGSGAALASDDISTVISNMAVPTADSTANILERDVVGNKTDAGVTIVGTTKSITAYSKGLVTMNTAPSADSTANAFSSDVVGNKTDASVYIPGTTSSVTAYLKGNATLQERVALKAAATLTNGQTLFTIAGGPVQILGLVSICSTGNDATASTLQYSVTPTSGSAQTISAASSSLANATAGASVTLPGTALATAALYNANGPNLIANPGTILAPAGAITAVVGVGSTTGTWTHYLRYRPMAVGVTVS